MRGLETFSSTSATPCGRSVTDSSRFILITPLLLSTRDQPRLPFPQRSLSCNPDQTCSHQPRFDGMGRILPQGAQSVSQGTQPNQAASNRRRPTRSSEFHHPNPVRRSRDRNPLSSELRAQECQKQLQ